MKDFSDAKILVVDDEEEIRDLVVRILKRGYENIETAKDGADALAMASDTQYDLVVTDLNMPKMSGQQLVAGVRDAGDDRVAFIVLTGHGTLDEAHKLLAGASISDFLNKPVEKSVLMFSVERALREQWKDDLLRDQNKSLEEKVQQRTLELERSFEELKRTQDILVQSEKMASLGGLVAGVAHEINTPLGSSFTLTSHLKDQTEKFSAEFAAGKLTGDDLSKFLDQIQNGTKLVVENLGRTAQLVRNFKQLAVDQAGEQKRQFKLSDIIISVLASLRVSNEGVSQTIECDESIVLNSYPGPLSQVLTNLIQNSMIHGFDGKNDGEIEISAELEDDDVLITYVDNGIGMPPEVASQIFEPFFTTKVNQGGSGLGMSISYNLVAEALGGTIACVSEPGTGSTFHMRIPQSRG